MKIEFKRNIFVAGLLGIAAFGSIAKASPKVTISYPVVYRNGKEVLLILDPKSKVDEDLFPGKKLHIPEAEFQKGGRFEGFKDPNKDLKNLKAFLIEYSDLETNSSNRLHKIAEDLKAIRNAFNKNSSSKNAAVIDAFQKKLDNEILNNADAAYIGADRAAQLENLAADVAAQGEPLENAP